MTTNEEILRNRVKFIGDGEWTLLGTPAEVIAELDKLLQEEYKRGYIDGGIAAINDTENYRPLTKQEEQ